MTMTDEIKCIFQTPAKFEKLFLNGKKFRIIRMYAKSAQ